MMVVIDVITTMVLGTTMVRRRRQVEDVRRQTSIVYTRDPLFEPDLKIITKRYAKSIINPYLYTKLRAKSGPATAYYFHANV